MRKNNIKTLVCIAALISAMSATTVMADDLSILQGENITHGTSDPASYDNVNNAGTFTNEASLTISNQLSNSGILNNTSSATANSILNETLGNFTNSGSLCSSSLDNSGNIINNSGASIEIANGTNILTNNGTISNNGTLTTEVLTNTSNINGNGTLNFSQGNNSGNIVQSIINTGDSIYENTGTISAGTLNNATSIINSGTISFGGGKNTGSISGGIIQITGNYTNDGEISISNDNFTFDKILDGKGTLLIKGTNDGNINQKVLVTNGDFVNNGDIVLTADDSASAPTSSSIINDGNGTLLNNDEITGTGSLTIDNGKNLDEAVIRQSSLTINGTKAFSDEHTSTGGDIHFINGGDIIVDNLINKGTISTTDAYSDGTITVKNGTNEGNIIQKNFTVTDSTSGFINNGSITAEIENSGIITGNGTLKINGGSNTGSITQGTIVNNKNAFTNDGTINTNIFSNVKSAIFNNNNSLEATNIYNKGTLNNYGNLTSTGELENIIKAVIHNNGSLVLNELKNSGEIVNNNIINSSTINNDGKIENIGGQITADNFTNNDSLLLNNSSATFKVINNFGNVSINNSSTLALTNQIGDVSGTINSVGGQNNLNLGDNINFNGTLNIGDDTNDTSIELASGNIAPNATLNISSKAELISNNTNSNITFNDGDSWTGKVNLKQGNITLDGFKNANASYAQSGGILNIINDSSLTLDDVSEITAGEMNLDASSIFTSQSESGLMILQKLNTSGQFNAMNNDIGGYVFEDLNIGTNAVGSVSNQANFTIDIYARSNQDYEHATDQFVGNNINGSGTINISDWALGEDIFGWDAPIDRDFELGKIFNYSNISPNIKLTATKKEVFTPIGWYQLNNHGGIDGNYTLNLTRFNPQVYRGQVTTLSQYMNQLAIDDMLFNHSMLLPSFKDDDLSDNGTMANRYAAANPLYAPYQYSKKDGGLWYKMYGTFETLQMNQAGLGRVGNNAYGTIIGADFGLKELKHGWKFMPTAYIGYNGAHQYFAGMGAYQNGGQAGFLGTWYKNNFTLGGLIYGGIYQNSMDIAGHTDNTFNYFAGASAKGAYNWRLHKDWVLQPNLMLAYNFFGQQNWHSDFGQMGMMSGTLNGINIAPGLNLIWEKETFSVYATLQYMYNINGAVDGRAGNVSLPHLYMDRGYIQYGLGFTKRFSDRFSGYFQTVFRNVGRTGVGFQLGLNIKLGK